MRLDHVKALARISCAVGLRDEELLKRDVQAALAAGVQLPLIREAVLQSYLFAGYAAAINAFHVINEMVGADSGPLREEGGSLESWKHRGEELCRQIYGNHYDKLVENMRLLHPDLADWMLWEGYGKVLCRPFLSPRVRELLIVAMTAVLNVERQFRSHIRGAIHMGATADEVGAVFEDVARLMPHDSIPRFRALLSKL